MRGTPSGIDTEMQHSVCALEHRSTDVARDRFISQRCQSINTSPPITEVSWHTVGFFAGRPSVPRLPPDLPISLAEGGEGGEGGVAKCSRTSLPATYLSTVSVPFQPVRTRVVTDENCFGCRHVVHVDWLSVRTVTIRERRRRTESRRGSRGSRGRVERNLSKNRVDRVRPWQTSPRLPQHADRRTRGSVTGLGSK